MADRHQTVQMLLLDCEGNAVPQFGEKHKEH